MSHAYAGLPLQVRQWDGYYSTEDPFHAAQRMRGGWVVVYDLRPLELVALMLGLRFTPWRRPRVIRYVEGEDRYAIRPLATMPIGFQRRPAPTCLTWWSLFWAFWFSAARSRPHPESASSIFRGGAGCWPRH